MAHTYCNKSQTLYTQDNPTVHQHDPLGPATVCGLIIATSFDETRTGGAPTIDGTTATQRGARLQAAEGAIEYWDVCKEFSGDPFDISIPNTGAAYLVVTVVTGYAGSGYNSAYNDHDSEVQTGNVNGMTFTPSADAIGDFVISHVVSGENAPGSVTCSYGTYTYGNDWGTACDKGIYHVATASGAQSIPWVWTSDDGAGFAVVYKSVALQTTRLPADNVGVSDSASRKLNADRLISEAVGLTDYASRSQAHRRAAGQPIGSALRCNDTSGDSYYRRALSAITSGVFSCRMKISITDPTSSVGPILVYAADEADGGKMFVRFGPTGYIEAWDYDIVGYVQLVPYQANTWYNVYMEFDTTNHANRYRAKIDSGLWSDWLLVNSGTYSQIDAIRIRDLATNAHEFWLDAIDGTGNWVATENFDEYSPSSDLNTLNGGSNWSGAWSKLGTGTMTAEEGGIAAVLVSDAVVYEKSVGFVGTKIYIGDSLGLTDDRTKVSGYKRFPAEDSGLADSSQRFASFKRTGSDNVGIADSAQRIWNAVRLLSEAVGGTDFASSTKAIIRFLSETEGLTDSTLKSMSYVRSLADAEGVTDSASRVLNYARQISEQGGITDSSQRTVSAVRSAADAVGLSDSAARSLAIARSIMENLGISDAITYSQFLLIARIVFDNIGVTDSSARTFNASRMLADNVGVSDFYATYKQMVRLIDEALSVPDYAPRISQIIRLISDDGGLTDAIAYHIVTGLLTRIISDSVGATDSVSSLIAQVRSIAESLGVTDSRSIFKAMVRSIADNLNLSDHPALTKNMARVLADIEGVSDYSSRAHLSFRTLSESVGATDAVTSLTIVLVSRLISEAVGVSDSASRVMAFMRSMSETLGVSDYEDIYKEIVRSIGEDIGATSDAQRFVSYVKEIAEGVGLSDDIYYQNLAFVTQAVKLYDSVGLIDGVVARTFVISWMAIVIALSRFIHVDVADPFIGLEVDYEPYPAYVTMAESFVSVALSPPYITLEVEQ